MSSGWMRNYGAMGDSKLLGCVKELENGYGDAVNRVNGKGGSVEDNLAKASYEARKRGLIDGAYVPTSGTQAFTEPKFCPECERKKPFHIDDYICRDCRKKEEPAEATPVKPTKENLPKPKPLHEIEKNLNEGLAKLGIPQVTQYGCTRDYTALGEKELQKVIKELKAAEGGAYNRVVNANEDVREHLVQAQDALLGMMK